MSLVVLIKFVNMFVTVVFIYYKQTLKDLSEYVPSQLYFSKVFESSTFFIRIHALLIYRMWILLATVTVTVMLLTVLSVAELVL